MGDMEQAAVPVREAAVPLPPGPVFRLPEHAVAFLRRPEDKLNLASAVVGILAAVLISIGLTIVAMRGYRPAELFNLRTLTGCVALAITAMALWSLVWSILRAARIRALSAISSPRTVRAAVKFVELHPGESGVAEFLRRLPPQHHFSPVLARVRSVLRQWELEPGLASADLVLQHQLYADEEKVAKAYGLMRTFVWAMPVLGLIGTVIGIALAVGGFATFLSGSVNDVETIKLSLVSVTQGLSAAFMTTMLGLVGALLTMLLVSSLQSREERIIVAAHEQVSDWFLPALQESVFPVRDPAGSSQTASVPQRVSDTWSQAVNQALSLLADHVGEASRAAAQESTRQISRLAEAISAGQQQWLKGAAEVATGLAAEQRTVDARAEELRKALDGMLERSRELAASQQALADTVERLERDGDMTRALQGVEEALSRLEPFLRRLSSPMVVTLAPEPPVDHRES